MITTYKLGSDHGMGHRRAVRGVLRAVSARLSKKISYPTGYGNIRKTDGSNA